MFLRSWAWTMPVFFALMVSAPGCSPKSETPRGDAAKRPDIVLVTFDTTRADHLGPYGCSYAFTPTLDQLARRSVTFKRAFASAPVTLPSHTTIMTGLYPFYHGVRDNSHFVAKPELQTLAEHMANAGYQTGAAVAAFVLDAQFGLDQGFDHYDDRVETKAVYTPFAVPERIGEHVTDAAIEWLKSLDGSRPYFLWVHYYDPHAGYRPPMTFTKYQGLPYDMEIAYADSELGRLLEYIEESSEEGGSPLIVLTADHGEALGQYGERTHGYFAYDSTLHVPLMFRLPGGDHAGQTIETVVSLVDIMPTIMDVIGLDVPPPDTIHGRSLAPLWSEPQPPSELIDRAIAFESYEPHYAHGWAPVRGVRVGDTKYFEVPKPELYLLNENPREVPEANQYRKRPELVAEMRERFRFLWDGSLSAPSFAAQPQTPDEDTLAKLRALGYAGGPLPSDLDEAAGEDLKDMLPSYNQLLEAMVLVGNGDFDAALQRLTGLYEEQPNNDRLLSVLAFVGNAQPAMADRVLPMLQERLASGEIPPEMMPMILISCAQMAERLGDTSAAIRYCSDAIAIQPDSAIVHWTLGMIYLKRGNAAAAIAPFARASELFGPKVYQRRAVYGLSLIVGDKLQEGFEVWRQIMQADPNPMMVWAPASLCSLDSELAGIVLPAIQKARTTGAPDGKMLAALDLIESDCLRLLGRYEDALVRLEAAGAQLSTDSPEYLTAKAILLRSLGRVDEAKTLLHAICEQDPANISAVRAYAGVLESMKEYDRAVEVLDRLFDAYPTDPMIMNDLAWMLGRQGKNIRRAILLIEQAISGLPGSPVLADTLGWLYHLDGRDSAAIPSLKRARAQMPNDAGVAYRLAVVLRADGDGDEAKAQFAEAVRLAGDSRPDWYEDAIAAAQQ